MDCARKVLLHSNLNNHYLSVHSFFEIRQVKTLCNLLERTDLGSISGSELMLSGRKKEILAKAKGFLFGTKMKIGNVGHKQQIFKYKKILESSFMNLGTK